MFGIIYDNEQAVSSKNNDSKKDSSMALIANAKATVVLINQELMRSKGQVGIFIIDLSLASQRRVFFVRSI